MSKYEVFLKPGLSTADIDANSAKDAKRIFVQMLIDNIGIENVIANNLDTENGEDEENE